MPQRGLRGRGASLSEAISLESPHPGRTMVAPARAGPRPLAYRDEPLVGEDRREAAPPPASLRSERIAPIGKEVDVNSILFVYACGAALLAVWLVVRFPTFGPSSVKGSTGMLLAAFVVASVVPILIQPLVAGGSLVAGFFVLVGLVLPTLALMFWAAVLLFRAFAGLFPGLR